jgi:hypothetical protein
MDLNHNPDTAGRKVVRLPIPDYLFKWDYTV